MASIPPPEPQSFEGFVETTTNALRLVLAARLGMIPRITRRLNDAERRSMIRSGAVFVFSVEESGIKRWTEGLLWSPSRIVGNFLVYREINGRSSRGNNHGSKSPLSGEMGFDSPRLEQGSIKANGLLKKTITVTVDGSDLHLISYYTQEDVQSGRLQRPSSRPDIMRLPMPPSLFRLTNFRNPPKIETGPDGKPRFAREPEFTDHLDFPNEGTSYLENSYRSNQTNQTYAVDMRTFRNPVPESSIPYLGSPRALLQADIAERMPRQCESPRITPSHLSHGSHQYTSWPIHHQSSHPPPAPVRHRSLTGTPAPHEAQWSPRSVPVYNSYGDATPSFGQLSLSQPDGATFSRSPGSGDEDDAPASTATFRSEQHLHSDFDMSRRVRLLSDGSWSENLQTGESYTSQGLTHEDADDRHNSAAAARRESGTYTPAWNSTGAQYPHAARPPEGVSHHQPSYVSGSRMQPESHSRTPHESNSR